MLDDTRHAPRPAPVQAGAGPGPASRRRRLTAGAGAAVALALGWAGLTGGAAGTWVFGAPAVLTGALLAARTAPARGHRLSPAGALGFALWFVVQAWRGGWDVARRALDPRATVAPGWHRRRLRLPAGAPRLVMANAVTLLPGTLSAELRDDCLTVHLLDRRADPEADLAALEARVRALFALPPEATPLPAMPPFPATDPRPETPR